MIKITPSVLESLIDDQFGLTDEVQLRSFITPSGKFVGKMRSHNDVWEAFVERKFTEDPMDTAEFMADCGFIRVGMGYLQAPGVVLTEAQLKALRRFLETTSVTREVKVLKYDKPRFKKMMPLDNRFPEKVEKNIEAIIKMFKQYPKVTSGK